MNTPTHIAIAALSYGEKAHFHFMPALVIGGLFPDFLMFVFLLVDLLLGYDPETIFRVNYFTPRWQVPIDLTNSIPIFAALAILAHFKNWKWLFFFSMAALLHIAFDLPVHREDAHAHFYPLSDWRYISPVSYWDRNYYAGFIIPFEVAFLVYAAFSGVKYFEKPLSKHLYRATMLFVPIVSIGFFTWNLFS